MIRLSAVFAAAVAALVAVAILVVAPGAGGAACTSTASSLGVLTSALGAAGTGATICLADGSYGKLALNFSKAAPGVTIRAANPGKATIDGATLTGSNLMLADPNITDEIAIMPGSSGITISHNTITGGYMGINMWTDDVSINDTKVIGNRFVGPFGEDAIRANRYHDGPDADPYGLLVEGNEFTGIRENGNHSDCLQSVWVGDHLYFRRNYLHDNRCQGFFVKDQPAPVSNVVVANNLMLRDAAPCDPPSSDCGPPSIVQIFGPMQGLRLTRNTIWTPGNRSPLVLREGPFGKTVIKDNVLFRGWSDWTGDFANFTETGDTVCQWEGTLPRLSPSATRICSPRFLGPARDDYRLRGGNAGITWSPSEQRYGPNAR
jgi:hypothetical protein